MRKFMAGKLHGIRVTEADLNYHGSITLDPDHCEAAGFMPLEYVEIWNKASGARLSTYVIFGERGSRCCILNGAAARTCQVGDEIIICNSVYVLDREIPNMRPRILTFDDHNNVVDKLEYRVTADERGNYDFSILDHEGEALEVPTPVKGAQKKKNKNKS